MRYVVRREKRKSNKQFLDSQIDLIEQTRQRSDFLTPAESGRLSVMIERLARPPIHIENFQEKALTISEIDSTAYMGQTSYPNNRNSARLKTKALWSFSIFGS